MLKKVCIIASFPAFILAARFIPFDRLPIVCAFLLLTGYPCPSCGMTRSVMALARLDFHRAMEMNPLGIAFAGIIGLCWVTSIYQTATGRKTRLYEWAAKRINLLGVIALAILLIFGAARIAILASR
jgi:hypothetical protein